MPLTVRQNGTTVGGQPNNATASWWNDYYDLLTGAMTDQPVTLGNTLTVSGHVTFDTALWISPQTTYGSTFPVLTLGLGDNDTGINWLGDGHLSVTCNGTSQLDVAAGKALGFMVLDSGTPRMVHVFIGTSTPVGAVEGDIWIKG